MRSNTEVTVNFGPFKGYKGTILSTASPKRVVVEIALKDRLVVVELDEDMVDSAKKARA
jgi:transcription antitermination factor NusG